MSEALESAVLQALEQSGSIPSTYDFCASLPSDYNATHDALLGVVRSLSADALTTMEQLKTQYLTLSEEGKDIAANGSQEARCFYAILAAGEAGLTKER